jgi:hypothetical protein
VRERRRGRRWICGGDEGVWEVWEGSVRNKGDIQKEEEIDELASKGMDFRLVLFGVGAVSGAGRGTRSFSPFV